MMKQQGATLAITLLLLLVITLIGVSSIQVTTMEEKMSANLQDKELSFRAAESALAAGETWILAQTSEPTASASCSAFPCVHTVYVNINFATQAFSWWQSNSAAYTTALDNVKTPPRYMIEFLQFVPDTPVVGTMSASSGVYYYQVTARGSGGADDSYTVLQTTVARRY